MTDTTQLKILVRLLVERQVKQAHLSGGKKTDWGSDDHITSLEARLSDLAYWRDTCDKGSEKRSHYRNLHNQLKKELASAKRVKDKLNISL